MLFPKTQNMPPPSQTHCDRQSHAGGRSRFGNGEVSEDLAEQHEKGVPHSVDPPPDFAECYGRRKSHHLFREVPKGETARVPLSKIPAELPLENLTPRKESRPVDNLGHMLDIAWASKREALTNHSVDGRGRVLLGCHRLVVPHNREHVREAFEIAHKELPPVRSSSVFLALVQECVEEDVDLHSHEILTPRHSVEDPSQEDKPPSKVTHAVLGLTLLICDRPSRLCGHALDIVLHALPHSGEELVQVGFWYALNLAFKSSNATKLKWKFFRAAASS